MDGLKSLDLFSGIGGFALAAERAGIETAAFCEIDKFPQSGAGRIPMAVSIAENIINRKDCNGGNGIGALEENCYTLNATGVHAVASKSRIRRLTPLECERLQGFPDNWTLVPDARDTNRYKACGNAITGNVAEWIFKRLIKCAKMR